MKKFDYSFLKNLAVPMQLVNFTSAIYALKSATEFRQKSHPDVFTALRKVAIVQSVKSSNAIEGIVTTDKRIEEIVNKSSAPLNHSEEEIAGYRDALNFIHNNSEHISVNGETILNLHKILLGTSQKAGVYKSEDNIIREMYADGSMHVRWSPVSAKETPAAMEELILAYTSARDDSEINQLMLIPCFVLDFLCIHPFADGNGRISRLLSLLLLYKAGFYISKYISFEEQINAMKFDYYNALKESSSGWHDNSNNYIPFIRNFLYSLYLCYKELDKRFLTIGSEKTAKRERVRQVVISAFMPISKREILSLVPDVSVTTIEAVLSDMLKDGKIRKIGTTKNVRYIKN